MTQDTEGYKSMGKEDTEISEVFLKARQQDKLPEELKLVNIDHGGWQRDADQIVYKKALAQLATMTVERDTAVEAANKFMEAGKILGRELATADKNFLALKNEFDERIAEALAAKEAAEKEARINWGVAVVNEEIIKDLKAELERPAKDRPRIVCLCGSTRFGEAFREAQFNETMAGKIVLTIGCNMKSDKELFAGYDEIALGKIKEKLDELHKRKIDLANEVLILNVGGYIGTSTRSELEYAQKHNKVIRYLEPAPVKETE